MSGALLAARVALAAVFAVAGLSKLLDLDGARRAVSEFGVPSKVGSWFGTLLPFGELAVSCALLARPVARWGAVGALALVVAFSVAAAVALARGLRPDCECFGRLGSSPIGGRLLLRNGAIASLAGLVLVAGWNNPGASATEWLNHLDAGALVAIVLAIILLAQAWFSWQLLRRHGLLLLRLERLESQFQTPRPQGPIVGDIAPDFTYATASGRQGALHDLLPASRRLVLLFTDRQCGACAELVPDVLAWHRAHRESIELALVDSDLAHTSRSTAVEMLVDDGATVRRAYGIPGVPAAVLVGHDGRIAAPVGLGADAVRQLLVAALAHAAADDRGDPEERAGELVAAAHSLSPAAVHVAEDSEKFAADDGSAGLALPVVSWTS